MGEHSNSLFGRFLSVSVEIFELNGKCYDLKRKFRSSKGRSMYYVITKGKGEGGQKTQKHDYVIHG